MKMKDRIKELFIRQRGYSLQSFFQWLDFRKHDNHRRPVVPVQAYRLLRFPFRKD